MAVELKRIGWKDEPSEDTPIDSGNLKQMENNTQEAITEVEKKPILKARINRQKLQTSGSYGKATISLGTVDINNDNEKEYLALNNNAITISGEAKLVKVDVFTGGIGFFGNAGDKAVMLQKNGKTVEASYQSNDTGYNTVCISTYLSVSNGDKISIVLESQNAGETEILEGYLQVMILK